LHDGVYKISVKTENWSEQDQALMTKYGEPEIDLGGTFLDADVSDTSDADTFTLSSNLVLIMSESPFTQSFDSDDYADAEERALLWESVMVTRIKAALTTLRANTDEFTTEAVESV
jgi:hypothetical protein